LPIVSGSCLRYSVDLFLESEPSLQDRGGSAEQGVNRLRRIVPRCPRSSTAANRIKETQINRPGKVASPDNGRVPKILSLHRPALICAPLRLSKGVKQRGALSSRPAKRTCMFRAKRKVFPTPSASSLGLRIVVSALEPLGIRFFHPSSVLSAALKRLGPRFDKQGFRSSVARPSQCQASMMSQ